MTAPAAPATDSSSNGDATSASPAYRMGMRLGRKTAIGCSITSLLLLALTPVSLAVFLAGTSLVQADADDHLLRWVTGASASLSAAFLAIGLLSLARERGWLAPRHALAAAITSVISGVIGAIANIAMTFSYDAKNLGAPEPLLGHLDMTLNRASWVVLAAAVAIAVSGLTVSRRLDPGLRAVAGIAVGALLAPAVWIAFSFLWMYAMAAPVVLLVVSTADKKPARPPAAAPRVAAAPRAVTTRRIMRDLPQMDLPRWRVRSIRLLGACATALGAVAAACVIMRIIGISAVAPREVLLTLGVPVGLIVFIPLLMALSACGCPGASPAPRCTSGDRSRWGAPPPSDSRFCTVWRHRARVPSRRSRPMRRWRRAAGRLSSGWYSPGSPSTWRHGSSEASAWG